MKIAVPKETRAGERRVALVPESCKKLVQAGFAVAVESGAGVSAHYLDDAYRQAGAIVETDPAGLLGSADFICKVNAPAVGGSAGRNEVARDEVARDEVARNEVARNEVAWMRPGAFFLASLMPLRNFDAVTALAERKVSAFSTDAIPRTTRAQAMDTLSSMASISGYKGVLLAADALNKYFPMLTTAAGMVFPAKVFVIGAAVAGLQAIATARRLGANVFATDVRPEVKEQIESVGAKYVGIELKQDAAAGGGYAKELSEEDKLRQREMLVEQCAVSDVVITTALIGGVFAPRLVTAAMVARMQPGSVLVDLAAEGGGNCELSKPGETVDANGVSILAPLNLPATMPTHASLLFSRNLTAFLLAFTKEKAFVLDQTDDIQQGALITHDGAVVSMRVRDAIQQQGKAS